MKLYLTIFFFIFIHHLFGQTTMDTSQLIWTRTEWVITNDTDSNMFIKLYKYNNGLYKRLSFTGNKCSEIEITEKEIKKPFYGQDFKTHLHIFIWDSTIDTFNYFYDKFGYVDSILFNSSDPKKHKIISRSNKTFNKSNKISTSEDYDGYRVYKYSNNDELTEINLTKKNGSKEISFFKNGQLIRESFYNTENVKGDDHIYVYDSIGNLIQFEDNKYNKNIYNYGKYGITKEEIIIVFNGKTDIVESTEFIYDNNGRLISEKTYRSNKLEGIYNFYYE